MNMNFAEYSPISTSMSLWIFAMLVEHDLLNRVPRKFPTREESDFVSYIMRKNNFNQMLEHNAGCIRRFGERSLNNVLTGKDFFTKMKEYCKKNAYMPGYIPL